MTTPFVCPKCQKPWVPSSNRSPVPGTDTWCRCPHPPAWPQLIRGPSQHFVHWPVVASVGLMALILLGGLIVWLPAVVVHRPSGRSNLESLAPAVPAPDAEAALVVAADEAKTAEATAQLEAEKAADQQPPMPKQEEAADAKPREESAPARTADAPRARALPKAPEEPPNPAVKDFKRRDHLTAQELREQLRRVPEVVHLNEDSVLIPQLVRAELSSPDGIQQAPTLLTQNTLLAGLPLRQRDNCQLAGDDAQALQELARELHRLLDPAADVYRKEDMIRRTFLKPKKDGWRQAKAVPTLVQLLQGEEKGLRLLLVETLAQIDAPAARTALAQRALFDLSEEVREAAVTALQGRSPEDIRPILVAGLRYPWAPVADHAAEALAALGDQKAIPRLEELLQEPPPNIVLGGTDNPTLQGVRELVQINHLSNCFLCHAPATASTNVVLGQVPVPGLPLPQRPCYGSASRFTQLAGNFVRADVTYLKQDFSVPQPVANPGLWPREQRHDYVVRTRKPTAQERQTLIVNPASYPQKEAVLFALRELKGEKSDEEGDAPAASDSKPRRNLASGHDRRHGPEPVPGSLR